MACLTPVTVRIDNPIGPLNSACYEPIRDKIFAVRDNWIYQLNGTTGAKEAESRFAYPGIGGDTYIDYDTSTDMLWATYWRSTANATVNQNTVKYLAKIDPDDITSVTLYDFTGGMSIGGLFTEWESGPGQIITKTGIAFLTYATSAAFRNNIARIDLTGPTVTHTAPLLGSATSEWTTIFHDGTNLIVGSNADEDPRVLSGADPNNLIDNVGEDAGKYPYGITSPGGSFAYLATATQNIVKAEIGGALSSSLIDLGRANANPHNIRYATPLNRIYIPLYKDDTVAVLNPLDDSFEIKTGFTAPWDVVVTGSKAFALQHSAIGIKEIV